MKNKLLKSLTCFASVFAIGSTIVVASTSCGCSNSTSNILPESVYKIENNVLMGFKDGIDLSKYENICDTMEIPARVTSVNDYAFIVNPSAQEIISTIPSYITKITFAEKSNCSSIGVGGFAFCKLLTSITFSSGLTTIGDSAFYGCSSLTSVDLSNCSKLTTIDGNAFRYCSKLDSITFPSSLESIGDFTFGNCSSLTSIKFPSSLKSIYNETFWECSNLSSITWDSWNGSFDTLDEEAFEGVCPTTGTVTVTNPIDGNDSDKLLKYLLDNGGLPSTWAKTIPLPENVYDIQDNVLMGFKDDFLENPNAYSDYNTMLIPASVTSVNDFAFVNTYATATTIPDFITKLTFAEGSNCSSIGEWSFAKCSSLTFVDFLNCSNFTTINDNAFSSCSSLPTVTFPSSLTSIGNSAFWSCNKLNYIAWDLPEEYMTEITVDNGAFSRISSTGTVESLNPSITSQELFDWIKNQPGFPQTGWKPAD